MILIQTKQNPFSQASAVLTQDCNKLIAYRYTHSKIRTPIHYKPIIEKLYEAGCMYMYGYCFQKQFLFIKKYTKALHL